jgi:hypothetical protein
VLDTLRIELRDPTRDMRREILGRQLELGLVRGTDESLFDRARLRRQRRERLEVGTREEVQVEVDEGHGGGAINLP